MIDPAGSVEVAILDTGVDASHPDLAGQLVGGATTDPHGHGTWMAGIVAADANNGIGIAGVGYDGVSVLPIAVLDANGIGYDAAIIDGLDRGQGRRRRRRPHGLQLSPNRSTALQTAIDAALAAGVVVVASVGNDGSTAASYPAGYPGVIGVAATDQADVLASFSNTGASAFIAAPGTGIVTLAPGGGTTTINGTSAAAAHVAGAAGAPPRQRRRTLRCGRPPLLHRRPDELGPRPPRPRRRPRRPRQQRRPRWRPRAAPVATRVI